MNTGRLKVAFCSAEVAPFSQVGGLGDVAGALPKALERLGGTDVIVLTPRYGMIDPMSLESLPLRFGVEHAGEVYPMGLSKGSLPGSTVPVYFLEQESLFGAWDAVYPPGRPDLEVLSFDVFAKAIFPALEALDFSPDILHLNDWHTAMAAPALLHARQNHGFWRHTRSVLSIHNLLHQGVYDDTNRLAEGLKHADGLTTVSPSYASEIQTVEYGAGLEALLQARAHDLVGIINGIDTETYDPQCDPFLPTTYTAETAAEGKQASKEAVQVELGLPIDPSAPLVGFVGRLAEQKGLDILLPAIKAVCAEGIPLQWAILGSGEAAYEDELRALQQQFANARCYFGFNLALAHKIYAGADMFVMPSRFEPCGLGQLIALRYGAVPIVRATGGLIDTVHDVRTGSELGNGFVFGNYQSTALQQAVEAAWDLYSDRPEQWAALRARGMDEELGWDESAREYLALYRQLATARAGFS